MRPFSANFGSGYMWQPPKMPRPLFRVSFTNLWDIYLTRNSAGEGRVRGVGVVEPEIDLSVLAVLLPQDVIDLLGLAPEPIFQGRLTPVRVTIRGRSCTLDRVGVSPDHRVILGHIPLTALGLKPDGEGGVMDDPYPSR